MELENTIELPASNTVEHNAVLWAEHFNNHTKPGQGMFFDFKATPELEKPALDCLIKNYGWKLERPFFIRKPLEGTS